jgi:hypothetical protein
VDYQELQHLLWNILLLLVVEVEEPMVVAEVVLVDC